MSYALIYFTLMICQKQLYETHLAGTQAHVEYEGEIISYISNPRFLYQPALQYTNIEDKLTITES